jgi:hypothetical protein
MDLSGVSRVSLASSLERELGSAAKSDGLVVGVEVKKFQPGIFDVYVDGPGLPSIVISIAEATSTARVIVDEYVFEPVPGTDLTAFVLSFLKGEQAVELRGRGPFRTVTVRAAVNGRVWEARRKYRGDLLEWEQGNHSRSP